MVVQFAKVVLPIFLILSFCQTFLPLKYFTIGYAATIYAHIIWLLTTPPRCPVKSVTSEMHVYSWQSI